MPGVQSRPGGATAGCPPPHPAARGGSAQGLLWFPSRQERRCERGVQGGGGRGREVQGQRLLPSNAGEELRGDRPAPHAARARDPLRGSGRPLRRRPGNCSSQLPEGDILLEGRNGAAQERRGAHPSLLCASPWAPVP